MTIDDLSDAWVELRNAAVGRGIGPAPVGEKLAALVQRRFDAFRRWRDDAINLGGGGGVAANVLTSVVGSQWVDEYRSLLAKVKSAGAAPEVELRESALESVARTTTAAAHAAERAVTVALVSVGLGVGVYFIGRATMRRGRYD